MELVCWRSNPVSFSREGRRSHFFRNTSPLIHRTVFCSGHILCPLMLLLFFFLLLSGNLLLPYLIRWIFNKWWPHIHQTINNISGHWCNNASCWSLVELEMDEKFTLQDFTGLIINLTVTGQVSGVPQRIQGEAMPSQFLLGSNPVRILL